MSPAAGDGRASLGRLVLRGAAAALGVLCLAALTAAAASAQTADLAITQTTAPNPAASGDTVTATITVSNNGPGAASNVAMVYLFPPDKSAIRSGIVPAGWTCPLGG